jgi:hypothetical protein
MRCLPSAASVLCVTRVDIGVVLVTRFYVPYLYVYFYAAFVYECQITRKTLTPQQKAAHENVTTDVLKQVSFKKWMTKNGKNWNILT